MADDKEKDVVDHTKEFAKRNPTLTGAAAGAVIGSVVPVVGTVTGAVVGGLLGHFMGRDVRDAEAGDKKKE